MKRKIPSPGRESNPRTPIVQPIGKEKKERKKERQRETKEREVKASEIGHGEMCNLQ
jgi:hypothetical protein